MNQEDKELLEIYDTLRAADVSDGLDLLGYHHYCRMDKGIRPLWRTKAVGIAKTARYLPYEGPAPLERGKELWLKDGWYYTEVSPYPWAQEDLDGCFMAIDVSGVDVGLLGSENTLSFMLKGCRGFVLNGGGVRDTDECIRQKVPVWSYFVASTSDMYRIRYVEHNKPIAIGGVAVSSGDIIIADGDNVIVVPRKAAKEVAAYASKILENDMDARKEHYIALGMELDETVAR